MSKEMIKKIRSRPQDYVLCQACGSILKRGCLVCPSCEGYNPVSNKKLLLATVDHIEAHGTQGVQPDDLA